MTMNVNQSVCFVNSPTLHIIVMPWTIKNSLKLQSTIHCVLIVLPITRYKFTLVHYYQLLLITLLDLHLQAIVHSDQTTNVLQV